MRVYRDVPVRDGSGGGRGGVERVAEWEARRHSHATENMFMHGKIKHPTITRLISYTLI